MGVCSSGDKHETGEHRENHDLAAEPEDTAAAEEEAEEAQEAQEAEEAEEAEELLLWVRADGLEDKHQLLATEEETVGELLRRFGGVLGVVENRCGELLLLFSDVVIPHESTLREAAIKSVSATRAPVDNDWCWCCYRRRRLKCRAWNRY